MKELFQFFQKTSHKIEKVAKKILVWEVDKKFQKIIEYQISAGGKRIRPALAILSCQVLGGKEKEVLYPAASLEILHNYTLIVDDIIDNSILRRGKKTVWKKFGRAIAQCIAMGYAASISQSSIYSKNPALISRLLAFTLKKIVEGEILDILFEQREREKEPYILENRYREIKEKDYLEMISKKTAILFQVACEIGGISAKGKKKQIQALKNYGFNLGMAFQITDDILDIFGNLKKFGKKIGKDIEERKLGNIVILYTLKELPQKDKKQILFLLRKKEMKSSDIKKIINLIKKTKAKEKSLQLAKKYLQKAKENLKFLPQNKWQKFLEKIPDLIIEREK